VRHRTSFAHGHIRTRAIFTCVISGAMLFAGTGASVVVEQAPAQAATQLPCDIYAAAGNVCKAAYSTTRALFASYNGPLYQIQRASDGSFLTISTTSAGGIANAAPQQSFCAGTTCTVTELYDQSGTGNNLPISDGGYWAGPGPNGTDVGANAMALPIELDGHVVYGIKVTPGTGYRTPEGVNAPGIPTGSQPIGLYEVTSDNLVESGGCCYDFGLGEVNHSDDGDGTMNAIFWGTQCWFGGCSGPGPWAQADLENGVYISNTGPNLPSAQGAPYAFASAWLKNNGTTNFTLKTGNVESGGLSTEYSGSLPNGYDPMKMQPDVLLGTGGDNSNSSQGEFFEGAIVTGYPSDATENAVQAELTTAGYGQGALGGGFPSSYGTLKVANDSLCLDSYGNTANAGAVIDQWACNGGSNQDFQFVPTSGGYGELQVESSGQDVTAIAEGSSSASAQGVPDIVQEPVSGTSAAQWLPEQQSDGSWQFKNQNSGLCLDVYGATSNQGQQLDQWPCKNAPGTNQDFFASATGPGTTTTTQPTTTTTTTVPSGFPSGYHTLVVANDSLCLDSFGNTANAGAIIDQWACNGGLNQDFQFVPTSGGYGELQVQNSGQDVTVLNSSTAQGQTDIVQEPVNGNAASQWRPEQQSDGSWQFQNQNSGLCLDVYGAGSNQGQQLDQWPCKNAPGTNQDFKAQ
jgi:hypothetical protein